MRCSKWAFLYRIKRDNAKIHPALYYVSQVFICRTILLNITLNTVCNTQIISIIRQSGYVFICKIVISRSRDIRRCSDQQLRARYLICYFWGKKTWFQVCLGNETLKMNSWSLNLVKKLNRWCILNDSYCGKTCKAHSKIPVLTKISRK